MNLHRGPVARASTTTAFRPRFDSRTPSVTC